MRGRLTLVGVAADTRVQRVNVTCIWSEGTSSYFVAILECVVLTIQEACQFGSRYIVAVYSAVVKLEYWVERVTLLQFG